MLYLQEVLKIDLKNEETFPAILNFSYRDIIRPRQLLNLINNINNYIYIFIFFLYFINRGEAMRKTQNFLPWKEILYLKDAEFCEKLNFNLEVLDKII